MGIFFELGCLVDEAKSMVGAAYHGVMADYYGSRAEGYDDEEDDEEETEEEPI